MSASVKGMTLVWKKKASILTGDLNWYQTNGHPNARLENGYVCIDAICAGDARDKGISVVDINTGEELTCTLPTSSNATWEREKTKIRMGILDVTPRADSSLFGGNPHCPYK